MCTRGSSCRDAGRSAFVAAFLVIALEAAAWGQVSQNRATLRKIDVDVAGSVYVVTLTADAPLSSRLHRLPGTPARLYLDLDGIVPAVAAHTPVDRGPLVRIRAGLNTANPPITRVVVDLTVASAARLERGATDNQLRIVIGAPETVASGDRPVETSLPVDALWCRDFAARVESLLQAPLAPPGASAMAAQAVWQSLEREADARRASGAVETIRFALLQAVRLGKIWATERQAPDQAAAARAGARLLLEDAQTRLAQLK